MGKFEIFQQMGAGLETLHWLTDAKSKGFPERIEGAEGEALNAEVLLVVQPKSSFTSS